MGLVVLSPLKIEISPVGEGMEVAVPDRYDLQPEVPQLQVVDDSALQEVADVGTVRNDESGIQLLADAGPADHILALQDQDREPVLGQIASRDQAVVAPTDDDGVVFRLTHRAASLGPYGHLGRWPSSPRHSSPKNRLRAASSRTWLGPL